MHKEIPLVQNGASSKKSSNWIADKISQSVASTKQHIQKTGEWTQTAITTPTTNVASKLFGQTLTTAAYLAKLARETAQNKQAQQVAIYALGTVAAAGTAYIVNQYLLPFSEHTSTDEDQTSNQNPAPDTLADGDEHQDASQDHTSNANSSSPFATFLHSVSQDARQSEILKDDLNVNSIEQETSVIEQAAPLIVLATLIGTLGFIAFRRCVSTPPSRMPAVFKKIDIFSPTQNQQGMFDSLDDLKEETYSDEEKNREGSDKRSIKEQLKSAKHQSSPHDLLGDALTASLKKEEPRKLIEELLEKQIGTGIDHVGNDQESSPSKPQLATNQSSLVNKTQEKPKPLSSSTQVKDNDKEKSQPIGTTSRLTDSLVVAKESVVIPKPPTPQAQPPTPASQLTQKKTSDGATIQKEKLETAAIDAVKENYYSLFYLSQVVIEFKKKNTTVDSSDVEENIQKLVAKGNEMAQKGIAQVTSSLEDMTFVEVNNILLDLTAWDKLPHGLRDVGLTIQHVEARLLKITQSISQGNQLLQFAESLWQTQDPKVRSTENLEAKIAELEHAWPAIQKNLSREDLKEMQSRFDRTIRNLQLTIEALLLLKELENVGIPVLETEWEVGSVIEYNKPKNVPYLLMTEGELKEYKSNLEKANQTLNNDAIRKTLSSVEAQISKQVKATELDKQIEILLAQRKKQTDEIDLLNKKASELDVAVTQLLSEKTEPAENKQKAQDLKKQQKELEQQVQEKQECLASGLDTEISELQAKRFEGRLAALEKQLEQTEKSLSSLDLAFFQGFLEESQHQTKDEALKAKAKELLSKVTNAFESVRLRENLISGLISRDLEKKRAVGQASQPAKARDVQQLKFMNMNPKEMTLAELKGWEPVVGKLDMDRLQEMAHSGDEENKIGNKSSEYRRVLEGREGFVRNVQGMDKLAFMNSGEISNKLQELRSELLEGNFFSDSKKEEIKNVLDGIILNLDSKSFQISEAGKGIVSLQNMMKAESDVKQENVPV